MPPFIGITPSIKFDEQFGELYTMALTYVGAVQAAGAAPIVLPAQPDADQLLERLDGLVLSGGGDIHPSRYGDQHIRPETYGISDRRDEFELALLRGALAREMPILAICRGIQVLNVGLGGTLWQDVAECSPTALTHRQPLEGASRHSPWHDVAAEPGGLLADVYGATTIAANSFHHQALKELGEGLRPIGWTSDGLIEAVSMPDRPFVLGVQWHPEMMYTAHPEHASPFARLVAEALTYARRDLHRSAAD